MNAERETKTRTCRRGHTTEVHRMSDGKWSVCLDCRKAYKKAYYEANREKVLERKKAYHEAVKQLSDDDEIKLNKKAYKKAYNKAYHEANRERINAARREKRAKEKREHGDK